MIHGHRGGITWIFTGGEWSAGFCVPWTDNWSIVFLCDFLRSSSVYLWNLGSGFLRVPPELPLCFDQSPLLDVCALKTMSHHNTWDLLGHLYTQAQEEWLKVIYQLICHRSLPRLWPLTLLLLCLLYFFHNPLELKGAVFRQFICPCNIFLVSESHDLAFMSGKDIFLQLRKTPTVIWVLPPSSNMP